MKSKNIWKIGAVLVTVYCSLTACDIQTDDNSLTKETSFNQTLADELARMDSVDQVVAGMPKGHYAQMSPEERGVYQDSVFRAQALLADRILKRYGYPNYDLVGEKGAMSFWLVAQHADHDTVFQQKVLAKMKKEVDKGKASARHYGLLTDRVRLNTGKPQLYGTQVAFNKTLCQAYPKVLQDSAGVNERRENIGLEPLEAYLNRMSEMHFEMNIAYYTNRGITGPTLYER